MKTSTLKLGGTTLFEQMRFATDFFSRFRGLMLRRDLKSDEAVFFPRCNSIHTFFMLIPIDVVFIDKNGQVVEVLHALKPWRLVLPKWKAKHTIEMKANRAKELGIECGKILSCGEEGWA